MLFVTTPRKRYRQITLAMVLAIFAVGGAKVSHAQACTLYASPSGNSTNSGTSTTSPLTLKAAAAKTKPGSVVCLMAGTYYVDTPFAIPTSGTSSSWIVYRSLNGGAVIAPKSGTYALFQVRNPVEYIQISGLQFEGKNVASAGVDCAGCQHLKVIGNTINHTGAGGVLTYQDKASGRNPDYITIDRNKIYHCGYKQGGTSGISLNRNSWSDQYQGFHSFVTNNMISGQYDPTYHTDGNGIIMDNPSGWRTPPVLIANNVVFENGGRCIHSRYATGIWIVNNTCYKNGLDLKIPPLPGSTSGNNGEYAIYGSTGNYLINNIGYAWNNRLPYSDMKGTVSSYDRNTWYTSGTGKNYVPSSVYSASNELSKADPKFVAPPSVNATADGQYNVALSPSQVSTQLHLQSGSPAIGAGIDPTTLPGVPSEILSGLRLYIYTGITGIKRPSGGPFNLGAY